VFPATILFFALIAVVSWERLALDQQHGVLQVSVWVSGLAVVFCAVSGRWFSLTTRAGAAAAVSWLTTAAVLTFGPVNRSWGVGESLALGILLAQAIRWLPAPQALGFGLALGSAAIIAPMRDEQPGPFASVIGVLTLCVAATFAYIRGLDSEHKSAVWDARIKERMHIARELHDLVAHHITGIVIQTNAIRLVLDKPDRVREMLNDIEAAGTQAMAAMQRLVGLLRDDSAAPLDPTPGIADIPTAAAPLSRSGVKINMNIDHTLVDLRPDVAAGVYRIVREALTNVARYAPGAQTRVLCRYGETRTDVVVTSTPPPASAVAHGAGLGGASR
jgi:signal transduction histidine kinase